MNKFIGKGGLIKDIELQTTTNGNQFARFTLAIRRKIANADGERESDFISCVVWNKQAEFLSKYTQKGSQIAIVGRIETRTYEANNQKKYATEVIVEEIELCDRKPQEQSKNEKKEESIKFEVVEDNQSLPFWWYLPF